jgi:mannose-1-phosphate guanylyltransferase
MTTMYAVVLAGGGGTRLWPLSRPERPKPFLPLLGDDTLIQRTVRRLEPLVPADRVLVVTEERYLPLVREQLPEIPEGNLVGEPFGRNTAAAVALAALRLDGMADSTVVMAVLPADHRIGDEAGFRGALELAAETVEEGTLTADERYLTLGVRPTGPETGYGYILHEPAVLRMPGAVASVERFEEKPRRERAEELIARGDVSWNAGIFVWSVGGVLDGLERYAPHVLEPIRAGIAAGASPADFYPGVPSTSIDYALLEPASVDGRVRVLPVDVGWSDLGSWTALRDAWLEQVGGRSGPVGQGRLLDVDSERTLVLGGERQIVTIGLRDTIVVDTPDGLLVCAADRSQDVRRAAEELARSTERAPARGDGEERA